MQETEPITAIAALAEQLVAALRSESMVLVAFSGGVDSAVVARAARDALGARARAVMAVGPAVPAEEVVEARRLAAEIGIDLEQRVTDELQRDGYRQNAPDRCYFCKTELYTTLAGMVRTAEAVTLLNGTNADDLGDHRPGLRAASEFRVRSPLAELGITKSQVRQLARYWQMSVADKPAGPCLASRIAYGVEVTRERLERVAAAERFLRNRFGWQEFRVRYEAGELARLELSGEAIRAVVEPDIRHELVAFFRELGFRCVSVDLAGFRSGSLNDLIPLVVVGGHPG